jgi:hypothetical protein
MVCLSIQFDLERGLVVMRLALHNPDTTVGLNPHPRTATELLVQRLDHLGNDVAFGVQDLNLVPVDVAVSVLDCDYRLVATFLDIPAYDELVDMNAADLTLLPN